MPVNDFLSIDNIFSIMLHKLHIYTLHWPREKVSLRFNEIPWKDLKIRAEFTVLPDTHLASDLHQTEPHKKWKNNKKQEKTFWLH